MATNFEEETRKKKYFGAFVDAYNEYNYIVCLLTRPAATSL